MRRIRTCWTMLLALVGVVGVAGAAPEIQVAVAPSRLDANLLTNADIADHDADQPVAWEFTTAQPDNFEVGWSAEGHADPGSLRILTRTGKMSGYFTQLVAVVPGDSLMVQADTRMTGGKLLVWLTGSPLRADGTRDKFDQRYEAQSMKQFFLAPTWIKREYLRGPDPDSWFLVHRAITIPEGMTTLKVGFGSYFAAGEMWVDDIYCGPAQVDVDVAVLAASEAEGDQIARVEVVSIPGPELVRDFPDLGGVAKWTGRAEDLDASLDLMIRVTTADGSRSATRIFPNPRGIH